MPFLSTRRNLLLGSGSLALLSQVPSGWALPRSDASTPAFIDQLIGRMTVEEKAGQLTLLGSVAASAAAIAANPGMRQPAVALQLEAARAGQLTGVFNGSDVRWHRQLQDAAMQSRLKIPLLFAADVIHGFSTVFPVPLAESASFEPALARRTARAAAREASAVGIDWTFAPMVDVARDARWGRAVEGAGEDVLLGRRMAEARVQGFQGEGLSHPDALAACPKHFAAYGAAEAGLDYNTVDVSERTLREVYFPPFQSAFDAGAVTTMAAFNELSGIPATGNAWLFDDVLRGQWKYQGLVVSDYTGDRELIAHGFASDERDATRKAFLAGVDISMQSGLYLRWLPSLVASGDVPMARLDESVRRVLRFKAALGLFDAPYQRIRPRRAQARQRLPETLQLARDAARRSVVMLKNDNALLPLARQGRRIALIGPMARDTANIHGPWTLFGGDDSGSDLASAMRAAMGDPDALQVVDGSGFDSDLPGGIEEAVQAASAADVVVLAIGEPRSFSGEAQSRTDIVIPAAQQRLSDAVAATGTPRVVLLSNGRALALQGTVRDATAILVTWFLGSQSGPALADLLFGQASPSGRLPVSFPRAPGQVPWYYAHKPTGRPDPQPAELRAYTTHYRDIPNASLYPFGHGLTYGRIDYDGLDIGNARLDATGVLTVRARIHNRGTHAAEEVVQLYIRDRVASITRPVRELKDFRKVAVAPGDSTDVEFTLRRQDLLFFGSALAATVEPGTFDLWVAPSAEAEGLHATFELLG
ncbi:glycoside hydrolase family 3 N-terminal domain-containing protein [Stenotrophomonas tumulicola]|uniref:beta-glucosidase n=1 Tax=Stenotrophomonas tumulicola TaxID=1685415 RepID=A0A7W3FIR3_9GAMM|nr:glycoside hydrolase family 3 N-terminal domain-containing protein [Stenotrophomonas tumulicola]MBA8680264.1 glycoside hydrolase family 3 C-terminal domain-containing protein [Stenotrophomonas tumulicola]